MASTQNIKPIFVVGSARSGTTMLGKLLFSHPDCFQYRAETMIMTVCRKRYGDIFKYEGLRERFLKDWFKSRQFERSNLEEQEFLEVLNKSESYPTLLSNFLVAMAEKAGKKYIVDSTPANVQHLDEILLNCANAKIIWVVRDGRDVSLSQEKLGWVNPPFPFKGRAARLSYALINWKITNSNAFRRVSKNLIVIQYENFLKNPKETLHKIVNFLDTDFSDYDLEKTLSREGSNSAFGRLGQDKTIATVARWKSIDNRLVEDFTLGCINTLTALGYSKSSTNNKIISYMRYLYFRFHLKLKNTLNKYYFFSKRTTEKL